MIEREMELSALQEKQMAANIRTERDDLSHVAGNNRSVSTNASHVS
jgi:hypothetical protein